MDSQRKYTVAEIDVRATVAIHKQAWRHHLAKKGEDSSQEAQEDEKEVEGQEAEVLENDRTAPGAKMREERNGRGTTRKKKKQEPLTLADSNMLRQVQCGACWTGTTLYKTGHAESDMCPYCKNVKHDVEHIIWRCPRVRKLPALALRASLKSV